MEETRKRKGDENDEEIVTVKRPRTPSTSEETDKNSDADVYDDITAFLSIGDENDEEAVTVKRPRTPSTSEETDKSSDADVYEDITAFLSIGDETASELSKLLETETTSHQKVRFIDDPYNSLSPIFQSSSSYVTINGNEESCGSSFSEMESSVMAGVDIVRRGNWFDDGWLAAEDGGAWLNDVEAARSVAESEAGCAGEGFFEEEVTSGGCDCVDVYDEMLARFIGEEEFTFQ